jgi:hypothetical protein
LSVPRKTFPGVTSRTWNEKARYIAAIVNRHRETYASYGWGQGNIKFGYLPLRVPQKVDTRNIARIVDGSRYAVENSDIPIRFPHKTAAWHTRRVLEVTSDFSGIIDAYNDGGLGVGDIEHDIACAIISRRNLALRQGIRDKRTERKR